MISLVVPSYNNLRHLKNLIKSFQKHAHKDAELIIIDDSSTDGTEKWVTQCIVNGDKALDISPEERRIKFYKPNRKRRVGHTILYDWGISKSTNKIIGILHADMYIGKNYIENLVKHLQPGRVVCATRIEPPLHPATKEKIIKDFGTDFDSLDIEAFDSYVDFAQKEYKDVVTQGMFAPWIMYKEDYDNAGGHDHVFAPFPFEDSDIFQRWLLNGYALIQSRDSFVYHLTCRGHRWNKEIGKDDDEFTLFQRNASRNYTRKWGTWIENDADHHPIIHDKYDIGMVVKNCSKELLTGLEIWCSTIYTDCKDIDSYIREEQQTTMYDLESRVKSIHAEKTNDIIVRFDAKDLTSENIMYPNMFNKIIADSGEVGDFYVDIFYFFIAKLNPKTDDLLHTFKCNLDNY